MNFEFFKKYQKNTVLFAQSSKDPLFSEKSNALPKNLKNAPELGPSRATSPFRKISTRL